MNIKHSVYAGNLSFDASEDLLKDAFAKVGTVVDAKLAIDPESGRFRGFGFVEMDSAASAEKAIKELQGKELKGESYARACYLEPAAAEQDLWDNTIGKAP
jgi:RNA recognition motif-containing protein